MRQWVLAACLLAPWVGGCSKVLGFDDLQFGPAPALGADAATPDAFTPDSGTDAEDADGVTDTGVADTAIDSLEAAASACDGVSCSGQGECVIADGGASCTCHSGFHAEGLACVPNESCTGVDCGRCGTCEVVEGVATCGCPSGFDFTGVECVLNPDPCSPNPCDSDHVCVPEAHCQPLGACVPTCDCSNCGNCGPDNSDGRWNDWQEYCGNLNASPATTACTKPCPSAGDGCIPYDPPMCWPMEGCFSL